MKRFTKLASLCLAFFLLLLSLPVHLHAQNVAKRITSSGDSIPYLEHKPAGYDAPGNTRKYPLIIFLHGGGQRNDDPSLTPGSPVWDIENYGPARLGKLNKMAFTWNGQVDSFIVLSPMCRNTYRAGPRAGEQIGLWPAAYVTSILNHARTNLKIDTNRVYLTGLSFGGGGTFSFVAINAGNPKRLAAAAPICAPENHFNGFGTTLNGPQYVGEAKLPVWGFHAEDDQTTDVTGTTIPINSINNRVPAPQVKVLMRIWPTGGHGIWPRVYNVDNPAYMYGYDSIINIYEWFLGQNKDSLPNVLPVASAGANQNISTSPGSAVLNGTGSTDAGGIVRYLWRQISGPTTIAITNTYTSSIAAAAAHKTKNISGLTTAGTYRFELIVVDVRAAFAKDTVTIDVTTDSSTGKAVTITSSLGKITTGDVTQLKNASKFTMEAQFKYISTPTTWTTIMGKSTALDNRIMFHLRNNNSIYVMVGNGHNSYGYTANNVVSSGNWYHVAAVFDGTQTGDTNRLKIYINGVQQNLSFSSDDIPASTSSSNAANFIAGGEQSCCYLDGTIDEVRVWNTALSAGTINAWKDKLLRSCHPDSASLVLYWPLDNNANPATATAALGTAYTGTITNGSYVSSNQAPDTGRCNQPPIVSAGSNVSITLPVDSIRIYGTATDTDGTIATFKWEYVDGPASYAIFPNAFSYNPIMKHLEEGVYRFRFTATDNDGASAYDTMSLTVNAGSGRKAVPAEKTSPDETKLDLSVHPNPVGDVLNVTLNNSETGRTTIGIYDAKGSLRKTEYVQKTRINFRKSINISTLGTGVYYLQVIINGKRQTMKFIKE